MVCNHTVVRQGTERYQCQSLDKHRQREGIHGEARGVHLKPQQANQALLILSRLRAIVCGTVADTGQVARLQSAVLTGQLLEGDGQK